MCKKCLKCNYHPYSSKDAQQCPIKKKGTPIFDYLKCVRMGGQVVQVSIDDVI